jgi:hypothetical protein
MTVIISNEVICPSESAADTELSSRARFAALASQRPEIGLQRDSQVSGSERVIIEFRVGARKVRRIK